MSDFDAVLVAAGTLAVLVVLLLTYAISIEVRLLSRELRHLRSRIEPTRAPNGKPASRVLVLTIPEGATREEIDWMSRKMRDLVEGQPLVLPEHWTAEWRDIR